MWIFGLLVCFFAMSYGSEPIFNNDLLPTPPPPIYHKRIQNYGVIHFDLTRSVRLSSAYKKIGDIKKLDEIIEYRLDLFLTEMNLRSEKRKVFSKFYTSSHDEHFKEIPVQTRIDHLVSHEWNIIQSLSASEVDTDEEKQVVLSDKQLKQARAVLTDIYNRWYMTANNKEEKNILCALYVYVLDKNFIDKCTREILDECFIQWAKSAIATYKIHKNHTCCTIL